MREQAPDFPFRIRDQILIYQAIYSPWQNSIEMRHDLDIVGVGAREFCETVGKKRTHFEMRRKIRPAAGERMTSHVDDFCVRQDEPEEADMEKVVRIFVDEMRQ